MADNRHISFNTGFRHNQNKQRPPSWLGPKPPSSQTAGASFPWGSLAHIQPPPVPSFPCWGRGRRPPTTATEPSQKFRKIFSDITINRCLFFTGAYSFILWPSIPQMTIRASALKFIFEQFKSGLPNTPDVLMSMDLCIKHLPNYRGCFKFNHKDGNQMLLKIF